MQDDSNSKNAQKIKIYSIPENVVVPKVKKCSENARWYKQQKRKNRNTLRKKKPKGIEPKKDQKN
jgi:hypothetical protein